VLRGRSTARFADNSARVLKRVMDLARGRRDAINGAMSIDTNSGPIRCDQCHRTVFVVATNLQHPCFRSAREQAECPEIRERRDAGEPTLDLKVCDGLNRSLAARFARDRVEAITAEGIGYVVRLTPGDPSPLYSPGEARWQAELLDRRDQSALADRFRSAADDAERMNLRAAGALSGKTRALAALVMMTVLGGAIWYFMSR
jgi:hypothetical protein